MTGRKVGRAAIRAACLATICVLAGCGFGDREEGQRLSFEEARTFFTSRRSTIEEALRLVDACRPERSDSYSRVWVKSESGGDEAPHCASGTKEGVERIADALRRAGILSVDYAVDTKKGASAPSIRFADFMLARRGLSVSGGSTSITYYREASPCAATAEGGPDQGFSHQKRPLTASPCHWFWEEDAT